MNNLSLKQLRYVTALAQHGHFGRAADACAVSQPALSMQIKELEAQLSMPLFDRSTKGHARGHSGGLRLTPFGQEFLARAQGILQNVQDLGHFVRAAGQNGAAHALLGGRLALGVIPTIAPYFLPHMMLAIQTAYAGLEINLREAMTQTLLADVQQGRLDAAILALPVAAPNLTQHPLFAEDFVLVRPAGDAGRPVPSAETLREMRLLLLEEGHCFRDQALTFCALTPSARPREVMDGSSLTTLVQMVAAGMGVTLIPDMALPLETRAAHVCVQRFSPPAPQRQIGMIWRKGAPIAGALAGIAGVLHHQAQLSTDLRGPTIA